MDEKLRQLIEALAAKIGTTSEYIWGILVRQAPISAATDLVLCIVITSALAWWITLVNNKTTQKQDCPYQNAEWVNEGAFLAWLSVFLLGFGSMIFIISSLQSIVTAFANPEYWALKKLLK